MSLKLLRVMLKVGKSKVDFLYELGIGEDTVKSIIDYNGQGIVLSFLSNKDNIINIIHYFSDIGIFNIDSLLIYKVDLFLEDLSLIKKKITSDMVDLINNDFTVLD